MNRGIRRREVMTMLASSRRSFLQGSAAAAAGAVLATTVNQSQAAGDANGRIRVALIGLGGRSQAHLAALSGLASENVELALLCDADETVLAKKGGAIEKQFGRRISTVVDMRRVFDDRSIDAVCFATPNHWHALGTIWACQAGKDVYVEKPGSHNIAEGRAMVEAARKYDRIVQHGTQCRSSPKIQEGITQLKNGAIGDVYMARGMAYKLRPAIGNDRPEAPYAGLHWDLWIGPAAARAYSQFAQRRWHNLWNFGNGEIGNQGVHQMDVIRWGLGLDTHPTKVQSMGGTFVHDDAQETPSVQNSTFEFAGRKLLVEFAIRHWYTNTEAGMGDEFPFVDKKNAVGVIFFGSKGYMIFPDYTSYHTFLGPKREPGPSAMDTGDPMIDVLHFRNFFTAVRSRKSSDLTAEILEGHMSSALCHLANIAYRTGRTPTFNPATEQFVGDPEADALLTRPARAPFVATRAV
jgi:predicted dehydrogenase